jgi:hypothetical protein
MTCFISSSRLAKWYVIRPGLMPARRAICTNDAFAYPISAMVAIVAETICPRRASSMNERPGEPFFAWPLDSFSGCMTSSLVEQLVRGKS